MICLIKPAATEAFRVATTNMSPPLGLAYVAAALEQAGHKVQIIDAIAEAPAKRTRYVKGYLVGLLPEEVAARVPAEADIIGISVIFTHEWPAVVRLIDLIKARFPEKPIVLGGEHVTSMPEFCLMTSKADFVVLGEGEETVVEFLNALDSGRPFAEVDGLGFRNGERIVINRRRNRRKDVDAIPWPAWHLFNLKAYHDNRFVGAMYAGSLTVPMLATRGCPYQCTYCSSPSMWTTLWVPRDPVKVVDEMQYYMERFGAGDFPFHDLTAIIQKDWIVKFCQEILRRNLNITWQLPSGTRSEAIDFEVAELLGRSGMINMAYAPESGSETTRRLIKKKMHTERLFESIAASTAAKLNVSALNVIGLPHDTPEHLAENLPFIDRLVDAGITDYIVSFYMALPGTELFRSLYDAGRIKIDRQWFCHMLHNTQLFAIVTYCDQLSRWQLTRWKLRMLMRFYRRKGNAGGGFISSLWRAVTGLGEGDHSSKLQTAFRNALRSAWDTVKTRLRPGWVSRREERQMFEGWDAIFRRIHEQKLALGVEVPHPADTTELHKRNFGLIVRKEHETPRELVVLS